MAREEQVIKIKIETGQAKSAVAGVNKGLDDTKKNAKKTGKGLAATFGAMKTGILNAIPALRAFSAALVSTGVGALAVAVGGLVAFFQKASVKGAEFAKSLSGLEAVAGASADEMERLSDQAKSLGSTTAFTASQVVGLQTELAKLGFSVQDISNSTPAILDLAASLDVDLASAAEFAGSVVRSFGLTTEDTQRVVDVMALSTASSALNFGALTESLKVAAPTARAVGVSIEKTTALLGVLADTGLKGSVAGTGLSKTFIALNKEGISLEEAMDKVRNSSNQLNTAVELVGVVGAKSLLNLANAGDKIGDLEDKFNNAAGAAKNIAETRLDNLAGDTTKLQSAWEGLLLKIEDGSGPLVDLKRSLTQLVTDGLTFVTKNFDKFAFFAKEIFTDISLSFRSFKDFFIGGLTLIVGGVQKGGLKIKEAISKIPIIGDSIDTSKIQEDLKNADKVIKSGLDRIAQGADKQAQRLRNRLTIGARFAKEMAEAEIFEEQVKQKKLKEERDKENAEIEKETEEERKKREDEKKKELDKLAKLQDKFNKQLEDQEDKTFLAKAQRQRERALAELDALKLSTEEKRKAEKAINDFYDEEERKAQIEDDNAKAAEREKASEKRLEELQLEKEFDALSFEEQRNLINERRALLLEDETLSEAHRQQLLQQYGEAEQELDKKKVASKQAALQAVANIAGAETRVGQALLIAKNALALKETLMDLKKITFKGTQAVAEAGVNAAQNVSESSKIGFPQNIITIAAAIGQGASIIGQVKKAVSKTKASGAGSATAPTVASSSRREATTQAQAPAFNVIGASGQSQLAQAISGQEKQPVKAFVTANDVTTAQGLERNIVEGASI